MIIPPRLSQYQLPLLSRAMSPPRIASMPASCCAQSRQRTLSLHGGVSRQVSRLQGGLTLSLYRLPARGAAPSPAAQDHRSAHCALLPGSPLRKIGRASCRERVWIGGGGVAEKKKN